MNKFIIEKFEKEVNGKKIFVSITADGEVYVSFGDMGGYVLCEWDGNSYVQGVNDEKIGGMNPLYQ